jgi:ParB family chromosome partitioning protein
MRRRGGLGRGLEALIPPSGSQEDARRLPGGAAFEQSVGAEVEAGLPGSEAASFRELPLDQIDPNPRQPRGAFDEESLAELSASIKAVGVLQPVVVRQHGDRWQLVMGERRIRAARVAGLDLIPAIVRTTEDDHLLRDALLENIHREDLNPLEEAAAYEQLLTDFDVTHEELAARLGRSRPVITNAMRLLRLPPSVQRRIAAGTLSAGHARAILSLTDPDQQERLADRIVAQGLTVRMAEELARRAAMGEAVLDADRQRSRTRPAMQAPGMAGLAERLSDRLETRVRVQLGKRKGKVLIEFATLDDLQRICDAIGLDREVRLPGDEEAADPSEAAAGPAPRATGATDGPALAGESVQEEGGAGDPHPGASGADDHQSAHATAPV